MHILITGGGGFVGAAVARRLLQRGDSVTAFDRAFPVDFQEGIAGLVLAQGDITDPASLFRAFAGKPVDAVVHCAAIVGVLAALIPGEMVRVNIGGSVNLFEAMALHGTRRAIHLSSEEVLGAFSTERVDETHPTDPMMTYGVTKLAVEGLGRSYQAQHGLEVINLRTSWVYGPDLPRLRVPKTFIDAAVSGRGFHLEWGADTRIDHTYIDDLVNGVLLALDCPDHPYDTYNIASDSAPSLGEMAAIICELVPGADITVGDGPYQHQRGVPAVRKGALSTDRARQVLGYIPAYDIRKGLAASIRAEKMKRKKD